MIKNKSILITGGAGFIGGHLFERLIAQDNFLIVIDNFNDYYPGKEGRFAEITRNVDPNEDYQLIKGNLVESSVLEEIKTDVDLIFHLAAQAGVRYSIKNAGEVSDINITSTVNVFEYGCQEDVEKVVYASSSSVYGNPQYTPVDEEHPKNPISPYAVSKLCGEIYADLYYREYDLPVTSLRFYTVYGPRGRPDMAMRKFFKRILTCQEIQIYGDGTQLRDFTYVSDIVEGLVLAAEREESSGEAFNLGVSDPISVNELVNKMYELAQKPRNVKHVGKKKGDVDVTHSNTEKAKKWLGYHPEVNIDEGLKRTFQWMKENV